MQPHAIDVAGTPMAGNGVTNGCCGVLVRGGRLLLGLRSTPARSHHGQWDVGGGHCEPGETDEQTMIRELQEELGVTPTTYQDAGVLTERFAGAQYRIRFFSVHERDGIPANVSDEHAQIAWHTGPEISKLDLTSPSLLPILLQMASD